MYSSASRIGDAKVLTTTIISDTLNNYNDHVKIVHRSVSSPIQTALNTHI